VAEWMMVELLGHRELPGFVDEVERFGAKFGRVRVPGLRAGDECVECDGRGHHVRWHYDEATGREVQGKESCATCEGGGVVVASDPEWIGEVMFGAGSVYALTPCSEEQARKIARRHVGMRSVALAGMKVKALPAASEASA
jgi:hypothetical protein